MGLRVNPLPDKKILVNEIVSICSGQILYNSNDEFVFERLKNIIGKGASKIVQMSFLIFLLTLSQIINFRLFQTQRLCRRQF